MEIVLGQGRPARPVTPEIATNGCDHPSNPPDQTPLTVISTQPPHSQHPNTVS